MSESTRDVDAERRVLGDALLRPDHIAIVGEMGLTSQCFDSYANRLVWNAVSALYADGLRPDPPLVIRWLTEHKTIEDVGAAYVFGLTDGAVTLPADTLAHYVQSLITLMLARRARTQLAQVDAAIREEPVRVFEHLARLQRHIDAAADPKQLYAVNDVELLSSPAPAYVIDGVLPADGLTMAYGAPASGKSFVIAVGLGLSVCTGRPWLGKQVLLAGPVMYVAAEGIPGIGKRVAAWKDYHGIPRTEKVNFYTWPHGVDLRDPASLLPLIAQCRAIRPRLIIFDTLARCAPGYNEIDGQHCGQIIATCDHLRRTLGECAIILIHHTAKNSETERGHTAFRGAFDCMMSVTNADDLSEVTCTKQKDDERFAPIRFVLRSSLNAESCVATLANHAGTDAALTTNADRALCVLGERFPLEIGATASEWMSEAGLARSTFYRAVKRLADGGHVILKGQHYKLARTLEHEIEQAARRVRNAERESH